MYENFWLYNNGTSSRIVFVRFSGELKSPKRLFENKRPLDDRKINKFTWYVCEKNNSKQQQNKWKPNQSC